MKIIQQFWNKEPWLEAAIHDHFMLFYIFIFIYFHIAELQNRQK